MTGKQTAVRLVFYLSVIGAALFGTGSILFLVLMAKAVNPMPPSMAPVMAAAFIGTAVFAVTAWVAKRRLDLAGAQAEDY